MQAEYQHYLKTAVAAADQAREITLSYFRKPLEITNKPDASPVTVADKATEEALKSLILSAHPDHGFLGEESAGENLEAEWLWIIDPIDGTKSFATGNPQYGTLIALLHKQTPVLGIIDHAALNERWIGQQGEATLFNGAPCQSSAVSVLADASLCCTTPLMFDATTAPAFQKLAKACRFPVYGGDCYNYGLLALGTADLVCEADLHPFDFMALSAVVTGAGGIISDWQGQPLTLESRGEVLAAANIDIHQRAVAALNA